MIQNKIQIDEKDFEFIKKTYIKKALALILDIEPEDCE